MTEIPEHLRKRAEEARKKAELPQLRQLPASRQQKAQRLPRAPSESSPASRVPHPRAPARALEVGAVQGLGGRRRAGGRRRGRHDDRRRDTGGGGHRHHRRRGRRTSAGRRPRRAHPAPAHRRQGRLDPGREGHAQDKVHVWPHLLAVEFVAALACTAFLLVFSIFVNAPLLELANVNQTPNPSKAPWYFLGLQELLTMFHPMVAGVTIPGIGLFVLILAPYIDRNPRNKPEDRKFAISLMTVHLMFWAVLVIIGSFFRGPGFNFTFPWREGLFFEL